MKKIGLLASVLLFSSSVAFATPLNDFSAGKLALDVSVNLDSKMEFDDYYKGENNLDYGLTVGLGKKFAFQYKNNGSPQSRDLYRYSASGVLEGIESFKLRSQEFNLLYKINNSLTVFTGVNQAKLRFNITPQYGYVSTVSSFENNKSNIQIGITQLTPINKKLINYSTVAIGKDFNYFILGLGYAIDKNLDLNVFYSQYKYGNFPVNTTNLGNIGVNAITKGLGLGITYKF